MDNKYKLKGSNYYINRDITWKERVRNKKFRRIRKESKVNGKQVSLRNDKLLIENDTYIWSYGEIKFHKKVKKMFINGTSSSKMAEKMPMTNLALDAPARQQQMKTLKQ